MLQPFSSVFLYFVQNRGYIQFFCNLSVCITLYPSVTCYFLMRMRWQSTDGTKNYKRSEYDTISKSYIPFSHVNGFRTANPGAVTLENQWPQHNNPEQLTYAFVTDAFPGKQATVQAKIMQGFQRSRRTYHNNSGHYNQVWDWGWNFCIYSNRFIVNTDVSCARYLLVVWYSARGMANDCITYSITKFNAMKNS